MIRAPESGESGGSPSFSPVSYEEVEKEEEDEVDVSLSIPTSVGWESRNGGGGGGGARISTRVAHSSPLNMINVRRRFRNTPDL